MTIDKIDIKIRPTVDRDTAELCLAIIQMYCNQNGEEVIGKRHIDGTQEFWFKGSRDDSNS